MLLLQHIVLTWHKECRGAPYSTNRNQMQKAYLLPSNFFDYRAVGFSSHHLHFIQNKKELFKDYDKIVPILKYDVIHFASLELIKQEDTYDIRYRYDLDSSIPRRYSFCVEKGGYIPLNELAMNLKLEEYGRILYNGKNFYSYTNDVYYQLHIINILQTAQKKIPLDIFISKNPDKIYQKLDRLS